MTRRNDKRNNNSEVSPFAQMILGAILSKGAGMIANALMDKAGENENEQPKDIPHTEEPAILATASELIVTISFRSQCLIIMYAVRIFVVLAGYSFPNKFWLYKTSFVSRLNTPAPPARFEETLSVP